MVKQNEELTKEAPVELSKEELAKLKDAADEERLRILRLILKRRDDIVSDYKNTIRHSGGLLTNSMVYAYSKGINDIFKLITKELV